MKEIIYGKICEIKQNHEKILGRFGSAGVDESNTINWLIEPFLSALGYDVKDFERVVSEYEVDPEDKRTGKVDFAIFDKDNPIIFIECKRLGENLDLHIGQIKRYYNMSVSTKIAVLTNGYEYRFYTDTKNSNSLDESPFLAFTLDDVEESDAESLESFTCDSFDIKRASSTAKNLSYELKVLDYLEEQLKSPEDKFVEFITKKVLDTRRIADKDIVAGIIPKIIKRVCNGSIEQKTAE